MAGFTYIYLNLAKKHFQNSLLELEDIDIYFKKVKTTKNIVFVCLSVLFFGVSFCAQELIKTRYKIKGYN